MIQVKNLSKSYGEKVIFRHFTQVFPDRCCLMGPSGCGKSTLFRILLHLEEADANESSDASLQPSITGLPEKVSVVFQEDRLCESFSAIANVALVSDRAKAIDLLSKLGLQNDMEKKVRELSGGQKRRVAIARALAFNGDYFLFDEPFQGLDTETKADVIRVIAAQNKPFLIITHDTEDAVLLDAAIVAMPECVRPS